MILNYKHFTPDQKLLAQPMVLLHGLFGSSDNLSSLAKVAQSRGIEVIVPDLRNHGESFRDSEGDLFAMVEDVVHLMDYLGHSSFYITGHSLGGRIAMLLALLHTSRVLFLGALDIAPVDYELTHLEIFEVLQSVDSGLSAIEVRQELRDKLKDHDLVAFLTKGYKTDFSFDKESLAENYPSFMKWPDTGSISNVPGICVYGGNSTYVTHKGIDAFKKIFLNIKMQKIMDADHLVHMHADFSNVWNKILDSLLKINKNQ